MRENRAGQATLEMAIFGSLIIAALVSLFSYAQRLNDEQAAVMLAFRRALSTAGGNGAASYVVLDTRRFTAGDFFRKGSRTNISGSGAVLWGKSGDSKTIWNINGTPHDISGISDRIDSTVFESHEETYEGMQKTENKSALSTTHTLHFSKDATTISFLDKDGKVIKSIAKENVPSTKSYYWSTPWK